MFIKKVIFFKTDKMHTIFMIVTFVILLPFYYLKKSKKLSKC